MSQEKVDRRKYEKKNRKKLEKQRKIRVTLKCIMAALVVGAIFGIPLGIKIYRAQPKFVGDSVLSAYVSNYIDENHAEDIPSFTSEEASTDEVLEDDSEDSAETIENTED